MSTPELSFSDLGLSPESLSVLREIGFTQASPIQVQAIPPLLQGRDLIGQSKTGSGKTAAFGLPILERLDFRGRRRIQALILCPTRELCTQVAREIRKLGRRHPGLQVLVLSGGVPLYPQLTALEKGVHVIVGTPGRVLDHLTRGKLDLSELTTVVLDEADRMLDMGFEEDMAAILQDTPRARQTVLFSATFPKAIESISAHYQRMPVRVTIADDTAEETKIRQIYHEVEMADKPRVLLASLANVKPESAIVFCNLKLTVAEVARTLRSAGIDAAPLHGDLEQNERDKVMAKFRNKSTRILIATDVAARGIDIEALDAVYNYDIPSTPEVYVHRIGRTGRAGKGGLAIAFVTPVQANRVQNIEDHTGVEIVREKTPSTPFAAFGSDAAPTAIVPPTISAKMETLYISAGRKDKMRPGDILGALTGEAGGLAASDIGKIEIHDRFSYVAVTKAIAPRAMQSLLEGRVKGRKVRVEIVR
jgi:ATP-independent RNA helicase DbpA